MQIGQTCICLIEDKSLFFFTQSGVDDPNFAYEILTELTRTFLAYADNVRAQDSAAYAIQVHTHTHILHSCLTLCVPFGAFSVLM